MGTPGKNAKAPKARGNGRAGIAAFLRKATAMALAGVLLAATGVLGAPNPAEPPADWGVQPAFAEGIGDENLVDPTQRADNSFIYDTTVASLFSQASLYNDRTVQVMGEVIGDRIRAADDKGWITLTETNADDKASISVLLSLDQTNQISHYGRYGVEGTTLQVRGIYHQACDEHDGLPDIHATTSSVQAQGADQPDPFSAGDLVPGITLLIIGFALIGAFYFARERTR